MDPVASRVAQRYLQAKVSPEMLWGLWLNVTEKTLSRATAKASAILSVAKNSKTIKAFVRIKHLVDNIKQLVERYDSKLREFRGQSQWTPELEQLAESLHKDPGFNKHLNINIPDLDEELVGGLYDHFKQLENRALYDHIANDLVDRLWRYTEGTLSQEEARSALDELLRLDFRKQQRIINDAARQLPELKEETDPTELSTFGYFEQWVRKLNKSFQDPSSLARLINDWEDSLPHDLMDAEDITLKVNLSEFESNNPKVQLYWYLKDLERFGEALEAVARCCPRTTFPGSSSLARTTRSERVNRGSNP